MFAVLEIENRRLKDTLKLLLKVAVTAACFWYISRKVDVRSIQRAFHLVNSVWLVFAVAAFMFSKVLSAIRLNIYFRNIGIVLSFFKNVRLYWLSMFYNIFLPGSISGDAYKIVRLAKQYKTPYKKTSAAVLLDRFSGLFALILLLSFIWAYVFEGGLYSWLVVSGSILCIPLYYLVIKFFFPYFLRSFTSTYVWAIAVQVFQLLCMFCILQGLHITVNEDVYLLMFMVSSVVAVLPFTIGGLGAREMVFLWGAQYFNLDVNTAVMASLLFYITTLASSVAGLPYVFADPLRD